MEVVFSDSITHPIKYQIYCSGFFVLFTMLFAVELYVTTVSGGCGWPIYVRVVRIEVDFWQFSDNQPNSDSVVEVMMLLMILYSRSVGPFS